MPSKLHSYSAPAHFAPLTLKALQQLHLNGKLDAPAKQPALREQLSSLIRTSQKEELTQLLKRHPHLRDARDENGNTPLHQAILLDRLKSAEALLQQGAKPNVYDSFGETPLMKAAESGNFQAMNLLMDYQASPRIMGRYSKETLLQTSLRWGDDSLPVLQRILQHYKRPNQSDMFGETPLITALRFQAPKAAKLLLQQGAKVNQPDISGKSPLMYAAHNSLLTRLLLEHGADPNYYSDKLNQDVVGAAIRAEQLDTLKVLAQFKAAIKPEHLELAQHASNPDFPAQVSRLASKSAPKAE